MDLESVLKSLDDQGQEKQASVTPNGSPEVALQGALASVLDKVASDNGHHAVAPTHSPVDDLMKLAGHMAEAEKEAEVALAGSLGRAFADAAIGQWASYDAHTKVASEYMAPSNDDLYKAAEEGYRIALDDMVSLENRDPAHIEKMAMDQGYEEAYTEKLAAEQEYYLGQQQALHDYEHVKVAEDSEYSNGQEAALDTIREVAAHEFYKGAQEVQTLIAIAHQNRGM